MSLAAEDVEEKNDKSDLQCPSNEELHLRFPEKQSDYTMDLPFPQYLQ